MGTGPLPVDAVDPHRRRPPIPIVPVDEAARADALARGAGEPAAWLAAVTGGSAAPRVRTIEAGGAEVLRGPLAARRDTPGMSVGEVALAVDAGRALAARAAAEGIEILVAAAPGGRDDTGARALATALTATSDHRPLGLLRRRGDATTAVVCGIALGAGEHGLGCVCDGIAALAGAAVATGIERDLRPRLAATPDTASEPLAAHLGLPAVTP